MIKEKVINTIKKYKLIEDGDKLVLGVSGGPDSMTMLHLLNEIKNEKLIDFSFVVAHVHHGLRKSADLDEEYVKEYCEKIGIPYYVLFATIGSMAKKEKRSVEDVGREIRKLYFNSISSQTKSNKIALAHNYNDSAETVIMNILRGCGTVGLRGIEPKNGKYIRPLIEIERKDIEKYCEDKNINPRHDETNDENIYTRNKIRNIAIPYIKKEFNPNIIESLNRLSNIAAEEVEYVEKQAMIAYTSVCLEENIKKEIVYNKENISTIVLDLKKFNKEEKIIQKKIILIAIEKLFGSRKGIEKIHIEDIIKLCNNNIGNKFLTPNKKTKIVIKNKKIYVEAKN